MTKKKKNCLIANISFVAIKKKKITVFLKKIKVKTMKCIKNTLRAIIIIIVVAKTSSPPLHRILLRPDVALLHSCKTSPGLLGWTSFAEPLAAWSSASHPCSSTSKQSSPTVVSSSPRRKANVLLPIPATGTAPTTLASACRRRFAIRPGISQNARPNPNSAPSTLRGIDASKAKATDGTVVKSALWLRRMWLAQC